MLVDKQISSFHTVATSIHIQSRTTSRIVSKFFVLFLDALRKFSGFPNVYRFPEHFMEFFQFPEHISEFFRFPERVAELSRLPEPVPEFFLFPKCVLEFLRCPEHIPEQFPVSKMEQFRNMIWKWKLEFLILSQRDPKNMKIN